MLLGMAQGQVEAVTREVGHVLLYVPVVRPDEFDVAISYLVRRLEENASSENFLSAAFDLATDPAMFTRERDRFVASLARARTHTVGLVIDDFQNRVEVAPSLRAARSFVVAGDWTFDRPVAVEGEGVFSDLGRPAVAGVDDAQ